METFREIYGSITTASSTKFFTTSQALQVKKNPIYLREYVQTKYGYKKFRKGFFTQSQSGYKILKRLTVLHHLILHNTHLAYIIEDILATQMYSSDKWFNQNILQPYYKFIKKFGSSIELYQKCKAIQNGCFKSDICQILFYLINIFRDLFKTVAKLSSLGRYFREKAPLTIDCFVQLITYNSQNFYFYLRSIIQEFIQYPQKYLSDKNFLKILKEILVKDIPEINEQMKRLFLDKYFYPFQKGYGVKLFCIQDKINEQNRTGILIRNILNETLSASFNQKETKAQNAQKNQRENDQQFVQSFNKIDFSQTLIKNPQVLVEVQGQIISNSFNKKLNAFNNKKQVIKKAQNLCSQELVQDV